MQKQDRRKHIRDFMRKKLVFFIYIGDDTLPKDRVLRNGTAQVHFKCLSKYKDLFDEATFYLSCSDSVIDRKDVISAYMEYIMELGYTENTAFIVERNTYLRESKAFRKEIAESKDNDGKMVFFAHLRGEAYDNESMRKWVFSNYYFALENMDEVLFWCGGENKAFFGYPLTDCRSTKGREWEIIPKFGFYFLGSIFWVNITAMKESMRILETEIPPMFGRFYSENFPASVVNWERIATTRNFAACTGFYMYEQFNEFFDKWCSESGYEKETFEKAYEEIMTA